MEIDGSTFSLTSCQELAKDEIEAWLLDTTRPEFILSGGAGVGKSTLLEMVLDNMDKINDMCELLAVDQKLHDVVFTATTNKAASVIDGVTIHSLLGISMYNDYKTGEVKYNLKNAQPVYNTLIVVDESSMVNDRILQEIRNYCKQCKILYVGDKNQLHPVGLNYSPVFDSGIDMVHMTTQCRQDKNSHLYSVISDIQKWVETGIQCDIREGEGVTYVDDVGLLNFVQNASNSDKIITFTNESCLEMNQFVRRERGLSTLFFEENECVMSNTTTAGKNGPRILTDAQYTIKNIGNEEDHFGMFKYRSVFLDGAPVDVPVNSIHYSSVLKSLQRNKDWRTYFNLKEHFVDIRDGTAITTHKSQGSTYDKVLINLNNFRRCPDKVMLARLIYVAISRARTEVYLYGRL